MSLVVRVLAPTGRDAELITAVLRQHGLGAEVCRDLSLLETTSEENPLGPLLIAEEALDEASIRQLGRLLGAQPAWSDLPLLILTGSGRENATSDRLSNERLSLGSPVLLERPIRTATLVSSARAACRARERQYEVRDALGERDRAVLELKHERETLQVMLDHLPVGVLLAEPSGKIVLGNRSIERILRHPVFPTPDVEAHGQWISFHPDGRRVKGAEYPLPRAMKSGQAVDGEEYLYQRGDGSLGWVGLSAAPILDEEGRITGGVVTIADVDRQRRTDDELRRSEERFRKLIENASVGVMICDTEGGISYANPFILRLLGYTAEDVRGGLLRWDELTPPEYAEADSRALGQLGATGTATPYEKEYIARDGRRIPLVLGCTLLPSQTHERSGVDVAVFLTDLSSQKQAESALVRSEKLAAVGRLAASISHEINNPLEGITNLVYLARQGDTSPEQVQTYLGIVDEELARVSQIVSQTLRFHRQSTNPTAITPQELLEPTLALYGGRLRNSDIKLELRYRATGTITCYEGEIRQVLNNLVSNAIDAMRNGGRMLVRTCDGRLPDSGAPAIWITVADTGCGMAPATLRHIFEPFYTTKGINGTGLGLWIAEGIIDKHQGRLLAKSSVRPGRAGTVFSLLLPRDPVRLEHAMPEAVALPV